MSPADCDNCDGLTTIKLAPHEFKANYIWDEHGLDPYFGMDAAVKAVDSWSRTEQFTDDYGRTWNATLYKTDDNGIIHPGDRTPQGTRFEIEEVREWRLKVKRVQTQDEAGQQSFNAHISPRWQGMKAEDNYGNVSELSVPDGLTEGINIFVQGSNIEFEDYLPLLQQGFDEVGVARKYFATDDLHPYSNLGQAELYVRLHTDESGPIHSRDGPIARMGHLLENDRSGTRRIEQTDSDENGNDLPGYRHKVSLDSNRINRLFPHHRIPKTIKHYYAQEAYHKSKSSLFAHPKLGAYYHPNLWGEKLHPVDDLDELKRELEETVLSILADTGFEIRPPKHSDGIGPYVKDAYFKCNTKTHDENPITDLNLIEIEREQTNVVVSYLADEGFTPVELETVKTLVTDGGQLSPQDIAEENNRSYEGVRQALKRLDDIVQHEYGEVSLKSHHIAELVHDAMEHAKQALNRAVGAASRAIEGAQRGMSKTETELRAWAEQHGISLSHRGDTVDINFGRIEPPDDPNKTAHDVFVERLRKGWNLWQALGRDPYEFKGGDYTFQKPERTRDFNAVNYDEVERDINWITCKGPLYQKLKAI